MSKQIISEIALKNLIKTIWDKFVYEKDPEYVVKRLKQASMKNPKQLNLPMNDPDKQKSKSSTNNKKLKRPKQSIFDLKSQVKMPDKISKSNWKKGFDLTKPPFYTDKKDWEEDNFDLKPNPEKNLPDVVDYAVYKGPDLSDYGFKLKPGNSVNIFDLDEYLESWNKAMAYQSYYEKKIKDFIERHVDSQILNTINQ